MMQILLLNLQIHGTEHNSYSSMYKGSIALFHMIGNQSNSKLVLFHDRRNIFAV